MSLMISTDNSLTINVKPIVKIKNSISIIGSDTSLPIEITADFTNIPSHLHEIYLSTLEYNYNHNIKACGYTNENNSEPKTIEEKKSEWRLNKIVDIIFNKFKTE